MRSGARFVRLPGYRSTGTLTKPNVSVPDQNGRTVRALPLSPGSRSFFVFLRGIVNVNLEPTRYRRGGTDHCSYAAFFCFFSVSILFDRTSSSKVVFFFDFTRCSFGL